MPSSALRRRNGNQSERAYYIRLIHKCTGAQMLQHRYCVIHRRILTTVHRLVDKNVYSIRNWTREGEMVNWLPFVRVLLWHSAKGVTLKVVEGRGGRKNSESAALPIPPPARSLPPPVFRELTEEFCEKRKRRAAVANVKTTLKSLSKWSIRPLSRAEFRPAPTATVSLVGAVARLMVAWAVRAFVTVTALTLTEFRSVISKIIMSPAGESGELLLNPQLMLVFRNICEMLS